MIKVLIKKLNQKAIIPSYETSVSSGIAIDNPVDIKADFLGRIIISFSIKAVKSRPDDPEVS